MYNATEMCVQEPLEPAIPTSVMDSLKQQLRRQTEAVKLTQAAIDALEQNPSTLKVLEALAKCGRSIR